MTKVSLKKTGVLIFCLLFVLVNRAEAASAARLNAAAKEIVEVIIYLAVIMATIGIFIGAIKIRKGMESEGKPVIVGSCICLFVASSLYMIVSFVWS